MFRNRLDEIEKRFNELSNLLASPEVTGNPEVYRKCAKERASFEPTVALYAELKKADKELEDNKLILEGKDEDMRSLAKEEIPLLQK
ncbi:MAG: PCRF domain-containing protein, partial [Deltaproteobacteria bacterium]|nr:PCRF domain-containing protein [Deltaproteobacteria bacterium]